MILVCGEALVDLFLQAPQGAELPGRAVAGGSPFNVAIGLARLGQKSGFLGGLSSDVFGQHLAGMLAREGVDLSHAVRSDRLTTISVVATNAQGSPTYAFHGENKADRAITLADLPADLPADVAAITFGSYTIAVDPVGESYLALARRERDRRVISLDPNIRPTVTPDLAAWRARLQPFLQTASIVKASDEDIFTGYGHDADIGAVARSWLASGPKLVVITRGPQGAVAYGAQGELAVPGRAVEVIDTVGAGDTFHAAILARLNHHGALSGAALANLPRDTLKDVLRHAIVASSITCSRRGADLPTASDVARCSAPASLSGMNPDPEKP